MTMIKMLTASIDGDAEDSDEKDGQNSNNINNTIHNCNRLYSIVINET